MESLTATPPQQICCSIAGCSRTVIEDDDRCLMHSASPEKNSSEFWAIVSLQMANGDYDFRGYIFPGPANFSTVNFSGIANFQGAIFLDEASFKSATFSERAIFIDVVFYKCVDYSGCIFNSYAYFIGASFLSVAIFFRVLFNHNAYFNNVSAQ
jgi:uncharacterized protein YjbI with pentapeptide repeats